MRNKRDANDMNDFQSTFNTLREDKPKGNFYVRYPTLIFGITTIPFLSNGVFLNQFNL